MSARRRAAAIATLALAIVLSGCTGDALGPATPSPSATPPAQPATPVTAAELPSYTAVARLSGALDCTGTLISIPTSATDAASAPAYVLTTGRCAGLDPQSEANETIVDQPGRGTARFLDITGASSDAIVTSNIARVEYATRRGDDIAVLRLDASLADLAAKGVTPLTVSSTVPDQGIAVTNVAVPTEDLPEADRVMRKGECTIGATRTVLEYKWLWFGALSTPCPGVIGGTAGAPLIADGQVVGMIGTTNVGVPTGRGSSCYVGRPCEVGSDGATFVADSSYSMPVASVSGCFATGRFALGSGCGLSDAQWSIDGGGIFGGDGQDGTGRTPSLTLQAATTAGLEVQLNVPIADAATCTDASTYDAGRRYILDPGDERVVPVALPTTNSFVVACIAVPGDEANAARIVFSIDTVAPTDGPELTVQRFADGGVLVEPVFDLPDMSSVWVKFGDPSETVCADPTGYSEAYRQPFLYERGALPLRFCAYGFDVAGNKSPVVDHIIDPTTPTPTPGATIR